MLETVWIVQVLGLLFSLPLVFGLVGMAHKIRPQLWPFIFLLFLYAASSLQTWRALFHAKFLSVFVLLLMLAAAIVGIPHLLHTLNQQLRQRILPDLAKLDRWSKSIFFILLVGLGIDLLFAAFPGYRYDQYNYHLVTPKLIDVYGILPPFKGTDHTHFTGTWEYFFTCFRLLLGNDLVVQTATTTFTFLSYLVPITGLLWQLARPSRFPALWWIGLPALATYIHVELEPVISAKPDFINVAAALAIVAAQALDLRQRFFFTFFFLVVGLAFKVTWIHAALALGLGLLFVFVRDFKLSDLREKVTFAFIGAMLAALCVLPVFVKNALIFGNPIHPTQAGPFHSTAVTKAFFDYWNSVSGAPHGLVEFLSNLSKVPWKHFSYYMPFLPLLAITGYQFFKSQGFRRDHLTAALPWFVSWCAYLALWGILFRSDIYNRFVAVACIFPLMLGARWLFAVASPRFFAVSLMIPFAINSVMEVKLKRMSKGALQSYSEYMQVNFSPSIQDLREAKAIEAHAVATFGADWSRNCNILSNKPNHFYFNTRFTNFDDYAYDYHISRFGRERYASCPWAFFRVWKVCYLIATHDLEFSEWPEPMRAFAQSASANLATGANVDLRLRFIAPSELDRIIATTPGCKGEAHQTDGGVSR